MYVCVFSFLFYNEKKERERKRESERERYRYIRATANPLPVAIVRKYKLNSTRLLITTLYASLLNELWFVENSSSSSSSSLFIFYSYVRDRSFLFLQPNIHQQYSSIYSSTSAASLLAVVVVVVVTAALPCNNATVFVCCAEWRWWWDRCFDTSWRRPRASRWPIAHKSKLAAIMPKRQPRPRSRSPNTASE